MIRYSLALRYALKDAWHARRLLSLVSLSVVIGLATAIAVGSFTTQLVAHLKRETRASFGADAVLTNNQPFSAEQEEQIGNVVEGVASVTSFTTMARCLANGQTRLSQVRALGQKFPFFGAFKTAPASAEPALRAGAGIVAEESLILQLGCRVGDPIELGKEKFTVLGTVAAIPGENLFQGFIAPRLYMAEEALERTGLVQFGSRIRHQRFVRLVADGTELYALSVLKNFAEKDKLQFETAEEKSESLLKVIGRVEFAVRFSALVLLILSAIGMVSASRLFLKDREASLTVLRVLGFYSAELLLILTFQFAIAILSAVAISSLCSWALVRLLPPVIAPLLASEGFDLEFSFSQVLINMLLLTAFAVFLLQVPLKRLLQQTTLRLMTTGHITSRSFLYHLLGLSSLTFLAVILILRPERIDIGGLVVGIGLIIALGFIGLSLLFRRIVARCAERFVSFSLVQGARNLFRPDNLSFLITALLGFGTATVCFVLILSDSLRGEVRQVSLGAAANLILFDIQEDQRAGVDALLTKQRATVFHEAPVVTMRLASIHGKPLADLLAETAAGRERWPLVREYRSTYREALTAGEELLSGEFIPRVDMTQKGAVPISLEERIAERLQVTLGSQLTFDVQGITIAAEVTSLRKVDWQRMEPNFFIVFPAGVLEEAPQSYIRTAAFSSPVETAQFLTALSLQFPNVSSIDARTVIAAVEEFLRRVSGLVWFIAILAVLCAALIVWCVLLATRHERLREAAILKMLGASKRQVRGVFYAEYGLLGLTSAFCGVAVAIPAGMVAAKSYLKVDPHIEWQSLLGSALGALLMVLILGIVSSGRVYRVAARMLVKE